MTGVLNTSISHHLAQGKENIVERSLMTRPTINGGSGKMGRSVEWELSTNHKIPSPHSVDPARLFELLSPKLWV